MAKNIIQYHFINSLTKKLEGVRYRDALTEGYSFTPNFFISAYVPDEINYEGTELKPRNLNIKRHKISHFENRLFDRDTLWLCHFDINLLYVMALYSRSDSSEQARFKNKFRIAVRNKFLEILNSHYDFFKITPSGDMKVFVDANFRKYIGKMYHTDDEPFILFAFEKGTSDLKALEDEFGSSVSSVEQTTLS